MCNDYEQHILTSTKLGAELLQALPQNFLIVETVRKGRDRSRQAFGVRVALQPDGRVSKATVAWYSGLGRMRVLHDRQASVNR